MRVVDQIAEKRVKATGGPWVLREITHIGMSAPCGHVDGDLPVGGALQLADADLIASMYAAWPLIESALRAAKAYREAERREEQVPIDEPGERSFALDWMDQCQRALDAALAALDAQPG